MILNQPTTAFIAGRCGSGQIKQVVIHETDQDYALFLADALTCSDNLNPLPCTSFHEVVAANNGDTIRMIDQTNQSITFAGTYTLPATSPALTGEAPGTSPNCTTYNIAIASPISQVGGGCKMGELSATAYKALVKTLCDFYKANPTLDVNATLTLMAGQLTYVNLAQLKLDVLACIAAPTPPPPADTPEGELCLGVNSLPTGTPVAVVGLNAAGQCVIGPVAPAVPPHPAATLTNNAAPFSWNPATQVGNVPAVTAVFNPANGQTVTTVGGVATISDPLAAIKTCGGAAYDVATNELATCLQVDTKIAAAIHPAATLTNNPAPFSWTPATQVGNIPQVQAALNGTGTVLTTSIGGASTVFDPLAQVKTCGGISYNVSVDELATCAQVDGKIAATAHPPMAVTFTAGGGNLFNAALQTLNIEPNPAATVVNDDQALTSADGSIVFTPSAPTGADNQVNYDLGINPAWLCAEIAAKTDLVTLTPTIKLLTNTCELALPAQLISTDALNSLSIGTDGGIFLAPLPADTNTLTNNLANVLTSTVNGVVATAPAITSLNMTYTPATNILNLEANGLNAAVILDVADIVCDGLSVFPVAPFNAALPFQLLQKDGAGVCQIVNVSTAVACADPLGDAFFAADGAFRRVRAGAFVSTIGNGSTVTAGNSTHFKATAGLFTVANPAAGVCPQEITITNLEPTGADIAFTVNSLNGTTQNLTLKGFANVSWVTAFGENNQGESLKLLWDGTTYTIVA